MTKNIVYDNFADYPLDHWIWPNFSPVEMACRGDGLLKIDRAAMTKLQALRNALDKPIYVNSAYRSPTYNTRIGGAKHSVHMDAKAFDISMSNHDPIVFEYEARRAGFTGFGYYPESNFMHIDTGRERSWGDPFPNNQSAPEPATGNATPKPTTDKSKVSKMSPSMRRKYGQ